MSFPIPNFRSFSSPSLTPYVSSLFFDQGEKTSAAASAAFKIFTLTSLMTVANYLDAQLRGCRAYAALSSPPLFLAALAGRVVMQAVILFSGKILSSKLHSMAGKEFSTLFQVDPDCLSEEEIEGRINSIATKKKIAYLIDGATDFRYQPLFTIGVLFGNSLILRTAIASIPVLINYLSADSKNGKISERFLCANTINFIVSQQAKFDDGMRSKVLDVVLDFNENTSSLAQSAKAKNAILKHFTADEIAENYQATAELFLGLTNDKSEDINLFEIFLFAATNRKNEITANLLSSNGTLHSSLSPDDYLNNIASYMDYLEDANSLEDDNDTASSFLTQKTKEESKQITDNLGKCLALLDRLNIQNTNNPDIEKKKTEIKERISKITTFTLKNTSK